MTGRGMVWNIDFVISSIVILAILLYFYTKLQRLPIERYRAFSRLISMCLVTLAVDLLTSFVNVQAAFLPRGIGVVAQIAYYFCITLRGYFFYRYFLATLKGGVQLTRTVRWLPLLPLGTYLCVLVIDAAQKPMTHQSISGEVLNLVCAFYAIYSIFLVAQGKEHYQKPEFQSLIVANGLLLLGIFFHRSLPGVLILNFFVTATILMLFLSMQDPKRYISGEVGAYNVDGLREVYQELNEKNEPVCTLGFVVIAYGDLKAMHGEATIHRIMIEIGNYLREMHTRSNGDWTYYYLDNGSFAILGSSEMPLRRLQAVVLHRFQQVWQAGNVDIILEAHSFLMRDDVRPHDTDEYIDTVHGLIAIAAHPASNLDENADEKAVKSLRHERAVLHALDRAIRNNAVEVWFQPIYSIREGKINGAEALSHLNDPQLGYISPGEFIDVAEKNGLIDKLGDQIIRKTCSFIKENDMAALGLEFIKINLSPIQLTSGDINRHFTSIVNDYGIPHDFLKVEITEAASVNGTFLNEKMNELRDKGFHMALDDFGTGYSNIIRVLEYPFDVIKLDLTLVWSYFREEKDVLPGLVSIFKTENYTVVAEGVENEAMARGLERLGVDALQGFYFSAALPPRDFVGYCRSRLSTLGKTAAIAEKRTIG